MWAGASVVGIWAAANAAATLTVLVGDLRSRVPGIPPAALDQIGPALRVFAPAAAFVLPFVWWIGVSALMLLATRLFGGRTNYPSMLAVVGVACVPWAIGYAVQIPAGLLQLLPESGGPVSSVLGVLALLVSLASLVWHVVLVVIGGRAAAGTSYRGAGASCLLTGVGCATAGLVLTITIITMLFVLSGSFGLR